MSASLFRRIGSSFIDLSLVMIVIYAVFALAGQSFLQNRIEDFDVIYAEYQEIIESYNEDLAALQSEYDAQVILADGDEDLEAIALEEYNTNRTILNEQNTIDINPYNRPLTQYYTETIYFFVLGFVILITILTLAMMGKTPGRRMFKVKLLVQNNNGEFVEPNVVQVFIHDFALKYFILVIVFIINMYYGLMLMLVALMVDVLLISFSRNRNTLRDMLLKSKVITNTL